MGKQSGVQRQTVQSTPWAPAGGAVRPALEAAQGLNFTPSGQLVQGEDTLQRGVARDLQAYAANDPLQTQANQYFANILGGQSNPYLDRMFGQAADQVRARLDSQFAAAGRYGSGDQAREIGQAYNDLATNIYGGQYQSDMNRMMQAAQIAPGQAYQGFARQAAAAQGLEDFDYNQQMQQLQDYLSLTSPALGAGGTQVSTTPTSRSPGAGILGGALGGASLAKTLGAPSLGPWAVAGGILGAL
jgi:hypothetical protein